MSGGLLPSATQCTTLPPASLTSNCKKQCGLAQNQSVTVAFIVTLLSASKAAFPWCAQRGTVTITTANTQANCPTYRVFIRPPRKILRPGEFAARCPPTIGPHAYFPESKPPAGSPNCLLYSSVSIGAHSISRISKVGACSRNRSFTATQGFVYIFGSSIVIVIST